MDSDKTYFASKDGHCPISDIVDRVTFDNSKIDIPIEFCDASPRSNSTLRYAVLCAGILQMFLSIFGYFAYYCSWEFFGYFPQFGPIPLENEFQVKTWYFVEYLFGLGLLGLSTKNPSKLCLTMWIWITISFTISSILHFAWTFPVITYEDHGVIVIFLTHLIFHLSLLAIARQYYKSNFEEKHIIVNV